MSLTRPARRTSRGTRTRRQRLCPAVRAGGSAAPRANSRKLRSRASDVCWDKLVVVLLWKSTHVGSRVHEAKEPLITIRACIATLRVGVNPELCRKEEVGSVNDRFVHLKRGDECMRVYT